MIAGYKTDQKKLPTLVHFYWKSGSKTFTSIISATLFYTSIYKVFAYLDKFIQGFDEN